MTMWHVEFNTDRFLPYLPEESQSNPGVYGFELAQWLSAELMKRKVVTSYPVAEDWGWFIEYLEGETELMVCCSSQAEDGEGYKGKPIQWGMFIRAPGGLFKRRKGPETQRAVKLLSETISTAFKEAGIELRQVEAQP
ncbi:MAG: hypothetical protein K0U79_13075 [Gammaproteobacteria bacterium]|nr:hypothetical protein [Gammaproteobacteria bacterium]